MTKPATSDTHQAERGPQLPQVTGKHVRSYVLQRQPAVKAYSSCARRECIQGACTADCATSARYLRRD